MGDVWSDVHKNTYAQSDWIDKPSIFAETAITYFPKKGNILELGAGQGQDSRFFASHGYHVISTDNEQAAIQLAEQKVSLELTGNIIFRQVDMSHPLPFENETFDVVYAHLSLHYFNAETTRLIYKEIHRVLKTGGVFACFMNSTNDPEYKTGDEIETDFFKIDTMTKRYFTEQSAKDFAQDFTEVLVDNKGETYKDSAKDIHNLIRYVGRKD